MSRSNLRIAIIILTVFAALVHLYICIDVIPVEGFSLMVIAWILNGLGYLGLLAAYLGYIPFFKGPDTDWALLGYSIITVLAWVILDDHESIIGWVTTGAELVLALAIYLRMRPDAAKA